MAASKAKPDTWMPLVIGTYLKNTGRLTTEQHGAYLLLLMDYWVNGPPADDDEDLMSITKLDAKAWKKHRPKLAAFFSIEDGRWRQATADAELAEWTGKKQRFSDRAAAGGRAKAAKSKAASTATSTAKSSPSSSAKSTPQAVLAPVLPGCTPSTSTEVEAPHRASTLSDEGCSPVPAEVRDAFLKYRGLAWTCSYIDRATWVEADRLLTGATGPARAAIRSEGRKALAELADAGRAVRLPDDAS